MNLIQEMSKMNKPEQRMFSILESNLNYWDDGRLNVVFLDHSNMSSTDKQYIKKAYPLLRDKGLIVRVKRSTYMINPSLIIPPYNPLEAEATWNALADKKFAIMRN